MNLITIKRFALPLKSFFFFVTFFLIFQTTKAQKINQAFQYHIHKTSEKITIDGIMQEAVWKNAQVATNFAMVLPMDTSIAKVPTEVRMTYDNDNLYIIATCYKSVA